MAQLDIKIINPTEFENWNNQILYFSVYSFFHSAEWSKVISNTYKYNPRYFSLFKDNNLCSVVPAMEIKSKLTGSRLVSLPFSDFCEPLFNSIEESEILKDRIFEYCKKNKLRFMEFRSSENRFPFETERFRTDLRHILSLNTDFDLLNKNLSENTKRNIKSAIKEGVQIKEENSKEGLNNFYRLQCITRRKHGLPPQPFLFFKNIYKEIISTDRGNILFAYINNKPIAALMFFAFGNKILYKFGASVDENLPKGTNHLLMWEAIKRFKGKGFKEFDFGRTETNHEGLRRFKLGFGADERIIYTTRYDIKNKKFVAADTKTTGIHNIIFRHSPIPFLKLIGNTIYKHMG